MADSCNSSFPEREGQGNDRQLVLQQGPCQSFSRRMQMRIHSRYTHEFSQSRNTEWDRPRAVVHTGAGYVGPDSFTFVVSDGQETSGPATVSIFVLRPSDPPTLLSAVATLARHRPNRNGAARLRC